MILTIVINQGSGVIHQKAPHHLMYEIHYIYAMIKNAGSNEFGVYSRDIANSVVSVNPFTSQDDLIAVFTSDTVGHFGYEFLIPEKAKFLSFARSGSNAFEAIILVHYNLIKATKIELLWEWFRKGR